MIHIIQSQKVKGEKTISQYLAFRLNKRSFRSTINIKGESHHHAITISKVFINGSAA